jgi:hypothetical protein
MMARKDLGSLKKVRASQDRASWWVQKQLQ